MQGYCSNCGTPLTGAFCGACGWPAQVPTSPTRPAVTYANVTAAAPSGSGVGKILGIVAGILLLLFVIGIAGAVYTGYWIKHKVASYADAALGRSGEPIQLAQGNTCALLSREDVQQVLGVAIEKVMEMKEGTDPGCAYYANPTAFAQLQQMALEQARRDSALAAKRPGPKTDNPLELLKDANQLEGIVKTLGLTEPDKEGRVFAFTLRRDFGRANWPTFRATMSLIPGFEDVSGVGDRAMIGSFGHTLCVLKADSMINLELTYVPDAHTRGAQLARRIASRL